MTTDQVAELYEKYSHSCRPTDLRYCLECPEYALFRILDGLFGEPRNLISHVDVENDIVLNVHAADIPDNSYGEDVILDLISCGVKYTNYLGEGYSGDDMFYLSPNEK